MAKIQIGDLASEINKILENYGDEVSQNMSDITQQIGKKGAQTLRNESKNAFGGTGDYAKGWTTKSVKNLLYTTVTIYNKTPGLPHLLEHGHAVVAGGRVAGQYSGKAHIAPVEQRLIEEFEREVKAKL